MSFVDQVWYSQMSIIRALLSSVKMSIKRRTSVSELPWSQLLVCGNKIGKFAFVGAGAVINRDIKSWRSYGRRTS